jgi:hypothetical protein
MIHPHALPLLLLLAGCASAPTPPAEPIPHPVPDPRLAQTKIAGSRGGAAWRPPAIEHVIRLDGQTCAFVDLTLQCEPMARPAAKPEAKVTAAATSRR